VLGGSGFLLGGPPPQQQRRQQLEEDEGSMWLALCGLLAQFETDGE
jgi:hypothetical protein